MAGDFHIRSYREQDESAVILLWQAVFPDPPPWNVPADDIRRKLAHQRELFLIAERAGAVIGTVMAGFDGHRGWIHRLAVAPEHRRNGAARALMAEAERRLQRIGCTKVNLQVRGTNNQVVNFYEKIGYRVEDRVSMGKRLGAANAASASSSAQPAGWRIAVTESIHLTEFRQADKAACVAHLSDRDIYDGTLRIPHPYTDSDYDKWMEIVAASTAKHGHPVHFAIRNADQLLLGGCGFEGLIYGHRAEIGYWLAKPYWGQGIMSAVVGTACEHAFRHWSLVRITAHVFEWNVASAWVLEKNGFQLEGHIRKHHKKHAQFLDSRLYAKVQ